MIRIVLVLAALFVSGCGSAQYSPKMESLVDPSADIRQAKTIGFVSCYWTEYGKARKVDRLMEMGIYAEAKKHLEKRGYLVSLIPIEHLEERDSGLVVIRSEWGKMPDLTLTGFYWETFSDVYVPGSSYSGAYYGQYTGLVAQSQSVEGHSVKMANKGLGLSLWSGAPEYKTEVWRGIARDGGQAYTLTEMKTNLITELFFREFSWRSK